MREEPNKITDTWNIADTMQLSFFVLFSTVPFDWVVHRLASDEQSRLAGLALCALPEASIT